MNIQQIDREPLIEVGILSAQTLIFEMRLPFRCGGKRYPAGRYCAGLPLSEAGDRLLTAEKSEQSSSREMPPRTLTEENDAVYLALETGEWLLDYDETPLPHRECFRLDNVCIGIGFHWQRLESQSFEGQLKLILRQNGSLTAVNVIRLEPYLYSVIASEMKAGNGLELLKAHSVISRSWLLAQLSARDEEGRRLPAPPRPTLIETEKEHIRWYERDAHLDFDVCADDHCQRYQGLGKVDAPQVREAIEATRGEILCFGDEICDARFHKCCGGMTDCFDTCWTDGEASYLQPVCDSSGKHSGDSDNDSDKSALIHRDLRLEEQARDFVLNPPESFCRTDNPLILKQIFNDYDQETPDFFRWTVHYTQEELSQLIKEKSGWDFGRILTLEALQRGPSGRIVKLGIKGEKKTLIIGKELEIRKFLSKTHLYSSAFVVDCNYGGTDEYPTEFFLHGAGWGHGVGLCQVGAAVMAYEGYRYRDILSHYYPKNELKKIY